GRRAGGVEGLAEFEVSRGQIARAPGVGRVLAGQRLAHRQHPLKWPDRLARTAALAQDDADSIEAPAQLVLVQDDGGVVADQDLLERQGPLVRPQGLVQATALEEQEADRRLR